MKLLLLFLLSLLNAKLFIKRVPDFKLKNYLAYRQEILVSPYKAEEQLKSSELQNYLPLKIKLIGNPLITIRKSND